MGCLGLIIPFAACALILGVLLWRGANSNLRKVETENVAIGLATALRAYAEEYKSFPTGTDAAILRALTGANKRGIAFLTLDAGRINAAGQPIDLWDRPYRFDLSEPFKPRVWSAGPDGKDDAGAEGSDDITSWR